MHSCSQVLCSPRCGKCVRLDETAVTLVFMPYRVLKATAYMRLCMLFLQHVEGGGPNGQPSAFKARLLAQRGGHDSNDCEGARGMLFLGK